MKTLVIMFIMSLFVFALNAQTGLFGLSFGDSYLETKTLLESDSNKYYETANEDSVFEFVSDSNVYVEKLRLKFDKDMLVAWQIFYLDQEEEDIEELVIDSAEGWHGTEEIWNDYLECWVWTLDDKKSLYIGYNYDYWLVAEYHNDDYSNFTELIW